MKKPTLTESLKRDVAILINRVDGFENRVNGFEIKLESLKPKPPKKVTKYLWIFKTSDGLFRITSSRYETHEEVTKQLTDHWASYAPVVLRNIPESGVSEVVSENPSLKTHVMPLSEYVGRVDLPKLEVINTYSALEIATYISKYRHLGFTLADVFKNFSQSYQTKWQDVRYHANILGANDQIQEIEQR